VDVRRRFKDTRKQEQAQDQDDPIRVHYDRQITLVPQVVSAYDMVQLRNLPER
jgi:hypothetical protein